MNVKAYSLHVACRFKMLAMNILKKIYSFSIRHFYSLEQQARMCGVKMGKNNQIFGTFWSSEPYLIEIGNDCQITGGVRIFTHGGAKVARIIDPSFDCFGKVKIGNNVYIGTNSLIMPGVIVGDNVLIAAGSVVTRSIPDNVVIGGNPAHVICSFDDYYAKNKQYNTGTKGLSFEEKKQFLLEQDNIKFIKKKMLNI